MTLWRAPVYSELPLAPVWSALARQGIGVSHKADVRTGQWTFHALHMHGGALVCGPITGPDEIGVIVDALPALPGLAVRLALIDLLLGYTEPTPIGRR